MGKKTLYDFVEELGIRFLYEKKGDYLPWVSGKGRAERADCLRRFFIRCQSLDHKDAE